MKQISKSVSYFSETVSYKNMKNYETNFGIRFILLIRVKRVIIGVQEKVWGCRKKPPCPIQLKSPAKAEQLQDK